MLDLSRQNPHIVLVDDEQSELDAYSFLLESMGVDKIKTISDSRRALQEVQQRIAELESKARRPLEVMAQRLAAADWSAAPSPPVPCATLSAATSCLSWWSRR